MNDRLGTCASALAALLVVSVVACASQDDSPLAPAGAHPRSLSAAADTFSHAARMDFGLCPGSTLGGPDYRHGGPGSVCVGGYGVGVWNNGTDASPHVCLGTPLAVFVHTQDASGTGVAQPFTAAVTGPEGYGFNGHFDSEDPEKDVAHFPIPTPTSLGTYAVAIGTEGTTYTSQDGDTHVVAPIDGTGHFVVEACPPRLVPVQIDIKPASDPNSMNLGNWGLVSVAILTRTLAQATPEFPAYDATSLDPNRLRILDDRFKNAGLLESPKGAIPVHGAAEDIDGDGDLDLVVKFRMQDLAGQGDDGGRFDDDTTVALLYGPVPPALGQRVVVLGFDFVRIVGR